MLILIRIFILGFVSLSTGLVATISGVGTGTIIIPAIVSIFNEKPSILVGSAFLMYLTAAATGLFAYRERGLIDLRSGLVLAIPTIPGVVFGTLLENYISRFQFNLSLGLLATIFASMLIIFRKRTQAANAERDERIATVDKERNKVVLSIFRVKVRRSLTDKSGRVFTYSPNYAIGIAINLTAAVLSGLFGAGAALIIVPTTILFVKMPSHVAIATTRVILVALDSAALLTHIGIGTINFSYALVLSVGATIGALIGARIVFSIKSDLLTKIVAIFLAILGIYLVVSSIAIT